MVSFLLHFDTNRELACVVAGVDSGAGRRNEIEQRAFFDRQTKFIVHRCLPVRATDDPGKHFAAVSQNLRARAVSLAVAVSELAGESVVPAGSDFVAVDGGGHFSLVLRLDGSLVAWGW